MREKDIDLEAVKLCILNGKVYSDYEQEYDWKHWIIDSITIASEERTEEYSKKYGKDIYYWVMIFHTTREDYPEYEGTFFAGRYIYLEKRTIKHSDLIKQTRLEKLKTLNTL